MKLTDREVEIIQLRDTERLSWSQIADRLETTRSSVNSSYRAAKRKQTELPKPRASATEVAKPEEAAALIDAATSPFATVLQAAKLCGFPPTTARRIMQRLEARYAPLNDAIRKVKREELIALFEDRAQRPSQYQRPRQFDGKAGFGRFPPIALQHNCTLQRTSPKGSERQKPTRSRLSIR